MQTRGETAWWRGADRKVGMLRPEQQSEGVCQVVVLPGRSEVVCHRQLVHGPAPQRITALLRIAPGASMEKVDTQQ